MTKEELKNRVLNGGRGSGQSLRLLCEVYENRIAELEQQIEKMKLCQNCKFEDNDYMEKPCCDCNRCLGDIKRKGTSDKWEIEK